MDNENLGPRRHVDCRRTEVAPIEAVQCTISRHNRAPVVPTPRTKTPAVLGYDLNRGHRAIARKVRPVARGPRAGAGQWLELFPAPGAVQVVQTFC